MTTTVKDSLDTPSPYPSQCLSGPKWEPVAMMDHTNFAHQLFLSSSPATSPVPTYTASTASPLLSASSSSSLSSSSSSLSSSLPPASSSSSSSSSSSILLLPTSAAISTSHMPQSLPEASSFLDSRFNFSASPSLTSPASLSSSSSSLSPPSSSSLLSSSWSSSPNSFMMDLGVAQTAASTNAPTAAPALSKASSMFLTNELAGSGCMLVNHGEPEVPGYRQQDSSPQQALPDDILEYTDLDRQHVSLYDDLEAFHMTGKQAMDVTTITTTTSAESGGHQGMGQEEEEQLLLPDDQVETALQMMHATWQHTCDELNIPRNPWQWNPLVVSRWVKNVCEKKQVADVSTQLFPLDGIALFELPASELQQYGEAGTVIAQEIDFYRAASSYSSRDTNPAPNNSQVTGSGNPMQYQMSSPCVSPTPSHSSVGFCTKSELSDDEGYAGSQSTPDSQQTPQRATSTTTGGGHNRKQITHLWKFLRELLVSGDAAHSECIRWIDPRTGIFKIENSKMVAKLWGDRKNRPAMNYDKMSRSIRVYYKKGIIKKTSQSKRLVYQFCPGFF